MPCFLLVRSCHSEERSDEESASLIAYKGNGSFDFVLRTPLRMTEELITAQDDSVFVVWCAVFVILHSFCVGK